MPPDYDTFSPPAAGSTYSDPVFGTPILRVSDALQTENNADGGNLAHVINEYATMSPFNEDGTLLLLQHESYDEQGSYVKDLPFVVDASSEPRWSRAETELLYSFSVFSLLLFRP